MPRRNGSGIALLADPTRRAIIAMLALSPARPSTLARKQGLTRSSTTRQLRLMSDAGLAVAQRAVLYTINSRRHGAITAWLAGTEIGGPFDDGRPAPVTQRGQRFSR